LSDWVLEQSEFKLAMLHDLHNLRTRRHKRLRSAREVLNSRVECMLFLQSLVENSRETRRAHGSAYTCNHVTSDYRDWVSLPQLIMQD
jgi:hypothetical protein